MPVKAYFPTYLYSDYLMKDSRSNFKLKKELLKDVKKIHQHDDEGKKWSEENYPCGYTSYSSFSEIHLINSNFASFEKEVSKHVQKFARKLDYELSDQKLEISNSWINIQGKYAQHSLHLHPQSVISGTYYLQCPKACGSLKFEDPRLSKMMHAPARKEHPHISNQHFLHFEPVEGYLILFESWLRHEVEANMSNKERISVSFNYSVS